MPSRTPDRAGDTGGALSARAWGTLFALCGALFLDALDVSMKGMAVPAIRADLGMSVPAAQWILSAYTLGFGSLLLLGGRVADLYGRKRVFLHALAAFVVASVAAALARDPVVLVVARFATGAAAAFTAPAGLSIITTSFAEGAERTRAVAVYSATGATGFSLGLVAGGLLSGTDWRLVFILPALLAAVTLGIAWRIVPDTDGPTRTVSGTVSRTVSGVSGVSGTTAVSGVNLPGAAAVTLTMFALVLALVRGPDVGWFAPSTLGTLLAAALAGFAFAVIERRSDRPLLPRALLTSGRLLRVNVGAMALLGGWVATLFVITVYCQQVRFWSPLRTGLAVAPTGVVVALLAPRVAAPLVARFGTSRTVLAGLCAAVLAYALLLPLSRTTTYGQGLLPPFLLVGLAFTLAYGPLNVAATDGVDDVEQGVAGALVSASFQIGPTLALAAVAAVLGADGTHAATVDVMPGLRAALLVPLGISLVGAAVIVPEALRPLRTCTGSD